MVLLIVSYLSVRFFFMYNIITTYSITNSTENSQTLLSNLTTDDIVIMHSGIYTMSNSDYFQLNLSGRFTKQIMIQGTPNKSCPII